MPYFLVPLFSTLVHSYHHFTEACWYTWSKKSKGNTHLQRPSLAVTQTGQNSNSKFSLTYPCFQEVASHTHTWTHPALVLSQPCITLAFIILPTKITSVPTNFHPSPTVPGVTVFTQSLKVKLKSSFVSFKYWLKKSFLKVLDAFMHHFL